MIAITPSGWALLVLASIIIGVSKTGFPGVGILAIPLVAMVIPARASTGLILPMLVAGDIMAVAFYRRHGVWKYLVKLLPCAVAGILIGYGLLKMRDPNHDQPLINDQELKFFIGVVILVLLLINEWRNYQMAKKGEVHVPEGWWFPLVMGVLAGVITMMANAAGPIAVLYLLAMRLPKAAFIGTGAWYFLILNTFKIPFMWDLGTVNFHSLAINAVAIPVVVAGGFAGYYLVRFVPEKAFTRIAQLLTAVACIQFILSPWTHASAPATAPASTSPPRFPALRIDARKLNKFHTIPDNPSPQKRLAFASSISSKTLDNS